MSNLFALDIVGEGTESVESLSSYLYRLAELHTVTPSLLVSEIASRWGGFDPKNVLTCPPNALIRPNGTTEAFVEALARGLARPVAELQAMTMLGLSEALHRSMGSYSAHLRWCGACLREQQESGGSVYFQLGWQVSLIEACPAHRVRLRDRCPACHRRQGGYGLREGLSRCIHCRAGLDVVMREDVAPDEAGSELWGLLRHLASCGKVRFPSGGVTRVVSALLDEAWQRGEEELLYQLLRRDDCIRFANKEEPVTLLWALRITQRLQVPLVDLLNGNVMGTNLPMFPRHDRFRGPVGVSPRQGIDVKALANRLHDLLEEVPDEGPAPSLRQIARELGASTGALHHRFPKEAEAATQAHLGWRTTLRARQRAQTEKEVDRLVAQWPLSGRGPFSRKGALRVLLANTDLPKNLLREELAKRLRCGTRANEEGFR